ncbi:MAG: hypothetical protein ABIJ08_04815 [Nanoarchaeota archaeon]
MDKRNVIMVCLSLMVLFLVGCQGDLAGKAFDTTSATLVEDGNNVCDWSVYDADPDGASIFAYNDPVQGMVVKLQGAGVANGYRKIYDERQRFALGWTLRSAEPYYLYVSVYANDGRVYYIRYDNGCKNGITSNYALIGLCHPVDNNWRTFTRDLNKDLQTSFPGKEITKTTGVLVRGSVLIDDINYYLTIPDSVCTDGDLRCFGGIAGAEPNTLLQECISGQWALTETCDYICKNNICLADCQDGDKRCSGNILESCGYIGDSGDRIWEQYSDCGERGCADSKCNECFPGDQRCEGNYLTICGNNYNWESYSPYCDDGCEGGYTVDGDGRRYYGECIIGENTLMPCGSENEGETRCVENYIQVCRECSAFGEYVQNVQGCQNGEVWAWVTERSAQEGECVGGQYLDCIPDCNGKDCGDDGCGGSCGSCLIAYDCEEGICKSIFAEFELINLNDVFTVGVGDCNRNLYFLGESGDDILVKDMNSSEDFRWPISTQGDPAPYYPVTIYIDGRQYGVHYTRTEGYTGMSQLILTDVDIPCNQ